MFDLQSVEEQLMFELLYSEDLLEEVVELLFGQGQLAVEVLLCLLLCLLLLLSSWSS